MILMVSRFRVGPTEPIVIKEEMQRMRTIQDELYRNHDPNGNFGSQCQVGHTKVTVIEDKNKFLIGMIITLK